MPPQITRINELPLFLQKVAINLNNNSSNSTNTSLKNVYCTSNNETRITGSGQSPFYRISAYDSILTGQLK